MTFLSSSLYGLFCVGLSTTALEYAVELEWSRESPTVVASCLFMFPQVFGIVSFPISQSNTLLC